MTQLAISFRVTAVVTANPKFRFCRKVARKGEKTERGKGKAERAGLYEWRPNRD
jgi:hypothetical protein